MKKFKTNQCAKFWLLPLLSLAVVGCSDDAEPKSKPSDVKTIIDDKQFEKNQFEDSYDLAITMGLGVYNIFGGYPNYWSDYLKSNLVNYQSLLLKNTSNDDHSEEYSMVANIVVFNVGMAQIMQFLDKYDALDDHAKALYLSKINFPQKLDNTQPSNYDKDLESTYNVVKKIGYKGSADDWAEFVDQQRLKVNDLLKKEERVGLKPILTIALATWVNIGNHQFAKNELVKSYQDSHSKDTLSTWLKNNSKPKDSGKDQVDQNQNRFFENYLLYSMLMSGNTRANTSTPIFTPYKGSIVSATGSRNSISRVSSNSVRSNTTLRSSSGSTVSRSSSSISRGGFGSSGGRGGSSGG